MFASPFEAEEKRFKRNKTGISVTVTVVLHALIILALLFSVLHTPDPPFEDNAGGMSVNFGFDEVGSGETQPFSYNPGPMENSAAAANASPTESTPEEVLSQDIEESDVVAPKVEDKPKPKVNNDAVFKPNPKPVTTTNTTKSNSTTTNTTPTSPQADPNAIFTKGAFGKPNNSTGDGTGGGKGDQGKPDGDPNSKSYLGDGGSGSGSGGGKGDLNGGFSLKGRKKIALPNPTACNSRGTVVIAIKVDRNGKVVEAKFRLQGSTVSDECNVQNALQAARLATFNVDENAEEIQVGTITYINRIQ